MLPGSPQPFASLKLNRRLATAFRSPATAASFKASIPGSKFPACYFACLPAASATRSALRLRYRPRVLTRHGRFLASCPLLLPRPAPRMARPASTPLRDFCPPKDQSVRLARSPGGPPSDSARSPFAPRSLKTSKLDFLATDHRSRSATFPEACCSSNLLEPDPLCARRRFRSIFICPLTPCFLKFYSLCFYMVTGPWSCKVCE